MPKPKRMTWFTSDQHFGHKNIINYVSRPFTSVEKMDQIMIDRWNDVVSPTDTVYHLGDISLNGIKFVFPLLFQLNGRIKLVPGGHDRWLKEYQKYKIDLGKKLEVLPALVEIKVEKTNLVLCHFPMLSWQASHYGSIHLHGHTHNTIGRMGESGDKQLPPKEAGGKVGVRMDVGVDAHNFYPISIGDVLRRVGEHNG